MKIWYGSNNKTFLDSAIEKYHRESTVIEQVCVPIQGQHWSIIDVKVVLDQTEHKNGYVKNTVFAPIIDSSTIDNLEAILNKTNFSPGWWSKYFRLYSCQNKTGLVDAMYFGSNDVILNEPELCDGNSCALDLLTKQVCKHTGNYFRIRDYSLQALLLMINRVKNKQFVTDNDVIECHYFARLVIFQFIHEIWTIVCPGNNQWLYDFFKGHKRNDDL